MIVNNLSYEIAGKKVLDNVSFSINKGDKIGLIGKNGAGKTTLLKILSGEIIEYSGNIVDVGTVGMLKQEIELKYMNYSVIDYLRKVCGIEELEKIIESYEASGTAEYFEALEKYNEIDGYLFDTNVVKGLRKLNMLDCFNDKVSELSGGEKIKVLLLELILKKADIILLDEPTNNLDTKTIEYLKDILKYLGKSLMIVSHDEAFLSEIVNKVFVLEDGKITEYNVGYEEYLSLKENEYNNNMLEYEKALKEKQNIKKRIQRAKEWENKGRNKKANNDNDKIANDYAKDRTKSSDISKLSRQLEKMEIPDFKYKEELDYFFRFDEDRGNKDIVLNNLVSGYASYESRCFKTPEVNATIKFGEKVSIVGSNGTGKTSLLKTILGKIQPISGSVQIGNSVKIGYISQETYIKNEKDDTTIFEYITEGNDKIDKTFIFNVLNKFDIPYEKRNDKYNLLSPGERVRVNLAKFASTNTNIIILDEPTNHLDIEGISIIYDLIKSYKGTIISVSHNKKYNEILKPDKIIYIETGEVVIR